MRLKGHEVMNHCVILQYPDFHLEVGAVFIAHLTHASFFQNKFIEWINIMNKDGLKGILQGKQSKVTQLYSLLKTK